ncbi:related to MAK32 protein [Ustilago trichophora]|uniref:Related to MAK32 protein n=1 Tax=Ustilago trichophora TaxID=86804 RepID=A0A5C3E9D2_9BASI|nr:related to MAK32 protein [Ustilago trichophora]
MAASSSLSPPRLATMGMFIIDTFQYLDPPTGADLGNKGLSDQIGGGGCYFAIGARPFLPPSELCMIVDRGCDWKLQDQSVLDRFNRTVTPNHQERSMWHFRSRPDGTTRAVNIYKGEQRGFDYLSPKIRLEPKDLIECTGVLPQWIHLICSPERALETIAQIEDIRSRKEGEEGAKEWPRLVYEPIPDSCVEENLEECLKVLSRLQVFSPNHEEAASLLGLQADWEKVLEQAEVEDRPDTIIDFVREKLAGGFVRRLQQQLGQIEKGNPLGPIICIRSGAWGSVVGRAGLGFHHVPAWHTPSSTSAKLTSVSAELDTSPSRIQDVTGAGNSFLGGFSAYLVQTQDDTSTNPIARIKQAAIYGAVSASLIIEQLGLPDFEIGDDGEELWNGHTVEERLKVLRERVADSS